MSAHRQHYFEANAARPRLQDPLENRVGQVIAVALVAVVALAAAGAHLFAPNAPVVTPVRTPVVEHYPLQTIEDARVEGFRAGFAAAIEQACSATALTRPIATR